MYFIAHLVIVVALLIASWTDLKTREVPDWLNYALIAIGVGFGALESVMQWSFVSFINSVAGLLLGVIIGHIMFYTGQWGGGDAKLIMGLGAIYGLNVFGSWSLGSLQEFIVFLINLIFAGAFYGMFWMFILAGKNWNRFKKDFLKRIYDPRFIKIRWTSLILILLLILSALLVDDVLVKITLVSSAVLLFVFVYSIIIAKSIETACMIKKVPVAKLTEGDWIVEDIKVKGKILAGPKDLGITKKQIAMLKKHKIKQVLIKEGVPFVPSFLIAYVLTMGLGNWLLLLI